MLSKFFEIQFEFFNAFKILWNSIRIFWENAAKNLEKLRTIIFSGLGASASPEASDIIKIWDQKSGDLQIL